MQGDVFEIKEINKEIGSKDVDVIIVQNQNVYPTIMGFPIEAIEYPNTEREQMLELESIL